jgi:two-component system alkaline phosphatase synthesis response regulator PhoP
MLSMENPHKIVVVDDEYFISRSLSFIFEKEGYACSIASDGRMALDLIKREKPDLVFLDISMPRMNGYQVCKEIRRDPELKNIYIIMLTALGQDIDQKATLEAGADEYMLKPFNPRLVRERVAKVLAI